MAIPSQAGSVGDLRRPVSSIAAVPGPGGACIVPRACIPNNAALLSTSYVLVETYALLDRRLGREAARRFREEFSPLLEIVWVSRNLHERAMDLFIASPHSLSLVDAASFLCLRDLQIERVWAFDQHFAEEGLDLVD